MGLSGKAVHITSRPRNLMEQAKRMEGNKENRMLRCLVNDTGRHNQGLLFASLSPPQGSRVKDPKQRCSDGVPPQSGLRAPFLVLMASQVPSATKARNHLGEERWLSGNGYAFWICKRIKSFSLAFLLKDSVH